jgi:hypothetical protein
MSVSRYRPRAADGGVTFCVEDARPRQTSAKKMADKEWRARNLALIPRSGGGSGLLPNRPSAKNSNLWNFQKKTVYFKPCHLTDRT